MYIIFSELPCEELFDKDEIYPISLIKPKTMKILSSLLWMNFSMSSKHTVLSVKSSCYYITLAKQDFHYQLVKSYMMLQIPIDALFYSARINIKISILLSMLISQSESKMFNLTEILKKKS